MFLSYLKTDGACEQLCRGTVFFPFDCTGGRLPPFMGGCELHGGDMKISFPVLLQPLHVNACGLLNKVFYCASSQWEHLLLISPLKPSVFFPKPYLQSHAEVLKLKYQRSDEHEQTFHSKLSNSS